MLRRLIASMVIHSMRPIRISHLRGFGLAEHVTESGKPLGEYANLLGNHGLGRLNASGHV